MAESAGRSIYSLVDYFGHDSLQIGVLEWRSLASLKASVIVCFVVLWNAGCLISVYLNNGFGQLTNWESLIAMALTCFAASAFALAVALSTGVQDVVLAESRRQNFRRSDFLFIGLVTGLLAMFSVAEIRW